MTKINYLGIPVIVLVAVILAIGLLVASPAHAATTFVVNSTADGGDNDTADNNCFTGNTRLTLVGGVLVRESECTLRAAIQQANATAGTDTINFGISTNDSGYSSATGVWTITPASVLPEISDPVTINGYTQPGATPNTNNLSQADNAVLKIALDGQNSLSFALIITGGSSSVKGLAINHFAGDTIWLGGAPGNVIEGNFIGTNGTGLDPSGDGTSIRSLGVSSSNNTIGGTTPAARNVISPTLRIDGQENLVQGNFIGTGVPGMPVLGTGSHGVRIQGNNNTIGGTAPGAGNVISSNGANGIVLWSDGNSVLSNSISSNGGGGIGVDGTGNSVLSNSISSNSGDGISVLSGTDNSILSNSISSNSDLGIDLSPSVTLDDGMTANDPFDTDTGGNNVQNFPVLTSAINSDGTVTVTGKLNSEVNETYNLQFFASPIADPSGNGEGKTFLGQRNVTTDASGNAGFSFASSGLPATARVVAATATSPSGDTSEFSAAVEVTPANDDFADARAINGGTVSVNGANTGATRESGEPDHLPADDSSSGENSVWFRWTAPATGKVTADTCTTSTDTVLAVYTGDSLTNLGRVADNDDECESGTGSMVTFQARAGSAYRIAVSGHDSGSEGTFTLDFSPLVTGVTAPKTRRSNITVRFSEPMAPDTLMRNMNDPTAQFHISQTIVLLQGTSSSALEVAAKVRCTDASCKTITLNPDTRLGKRKTYTVEIRGALDVQESGIGVAVQDRRGNKLVQDYFRTFRTRDL